MHPLLAFKNLINKNQQRVTTGVVVSVGGDGIQVSTDSGVRTMTQTDATTYRSGDKVQIQGQIITGKVAPENGVKVYIV